jgi:hypothetical protein
VSGERRSRDRQIVTVQVGTTTGTLYLAVPVARSRDGRLSIPAYPAIVGPPAVDTKADPRSETDVDDVALRTVAERALRNYLSVNRSDLLADLTDDAVVSLPTDSFELNGVDDVTWVVQGRRIALEALATDGQGTRLRLRYELEVIKSDRWFVRSIHVDPTSGGRRSNP